MNIIYELFRILPSDHPSFKARFLGIYSNESGHGLHSIKDFLEDIRLDDGEAKTLFFQSVKDLEWEIKNSPKREKEISYCINGSIYDIINVSIIYINYYEEKNIIEISLHPTTFKPEIEMIKRDADKRDYLKGVNLSSISAINEIDNGWTISIPEDKFLKYLEEIEVENGGVNIDYSEEIFTSEENFIVGYNDFYWIGTNGNLYYKNLFSYKKAEKAIKTLKNCKGCINSRDLINAEGIHFCQMNNT